ncbi:deoxyribodipyrimidine photo-lyase [Naumannella sp. ID2617S]|nr:deoxyribodipyrimidine photo-lyase [Naumannella sp. ID2617S]
MTNLLWLRRDLRLHDHPALGAAADGADVVALFVLDPVLLNGAGAARQAWLAATLRACEEAYQGRLVLRVGDPRQVVPEVAAEASASAVHVTAETTPFGRRRDAAVRRQLSQQGVAWVETGSPYAVTPPRVVNRQGDGYRVFSPFQRAWQDHGWRAPAADPPRLRLLRLESHPDARQWLDAATAGYPGALQAAGEQAALQRWEEFLENDLADYVTGQNRFDLDGTSRLSPHLKLGTIHPRTLLHDLAGRRGKGAQKFTAELCWREFYADVLWRQPASLWQDLRPELSTMAYQQDAEKLQRWREGRTGFPVVDAGMRQLLECGWMHNRARMLTASFLCKDLHQWWPVGARHFLDHLIDGDVASNNHGWQWVAGTGTDAAPYFRVFNPISQGLRFDPDGDYVRRYVPELRHLPGAAAHQPWDAADGYRHGYPEPMVDHAAERREALARYQAARGR